MARCIACGRRLSWLSRQGWYGSLHFHTPRCPGEVVPDVKLATIYARRGKLVYRRVAK